MAMKIWRHLRAIVLLPGMVLVVIPSTILWLNGADTIGLWRSIPSSRVVLTIVGIACISLGLTLMVGTIRLFARVGKGTLAPWEPPKRLVVQGVYRYVRNPMICGVLFVLLGVSMTTACVPLIHWFLIFAIINAIYIPLLEEPWLVRRFGDDYLTYKQNVPRWIPRWKPWEGESGHAE
jgi:protein-S-isoprenylcysteine O-methyltransferase Ste14